jgi:hypothetical protein
LVISQNRNKEIKISQHFANEPFRDKRSSKKEVIWENNGRKMYERENEISVIYESVSEEN